MGAELFAIRFIFRFQRATLVVYRLSSGEPFACNLLEAVRPGPTLERRPFAHARLGPLRGHPASLARARIQTRAGGVRGGARGYVAEPDSQRVQRPLLVGLPAVFYRAHPIDSITIARVG